MLATNYYDATMAMFEALNKVNGDLSDNQAKLKDALAHLTIDAPNGKISLDEDRQAIGTELRHRGGRGRQGRPCQQGREGRARRASDASAIRADVFIKIGPPSRTNPECKKY